jgi:hypothetical protein
MTCLVELWLLQKLLWAVTFAKDVVESCFWKTFSHLRAGPTCHAQNRSSSSSRQCSPRQVTPAGWGWPHRARWDWAELLAGAREIEEIEKSSRSGNRARARGQPWPTARRCSMVLLGSPPRLAVLLGSRAFLVAARMCSAVAGPELRRKGLRRCSNVLDGAANATAHRRGPAG